LHAADKGTGDNAYIYLAPNSTKAYIRGTIPIDQHAFSISGSFPDPPLQLIAWFTGKLDSAKLSPNHFMVSHNKMIPELHPLLNIYSPTLDSLNYWFLKKSINLYGECLIKTMAINQHKKGSTEEGVKLLKIFWKEHGIDPAALHIMDGSGLSPQTRITTDELITALQFATHKSWYHNFYDALPVFNQMKLKSGTIGGSKSFAGYHVAKDGTSYTVAMIINNFDGSGPEIVRKMFRVLDELK
jgi:D-alanyl-D-alanine carboxypeptidase/D-alanyl-D-alanine-endopeptidase (penicillin-binding protein 4)